MKYLLRFLAAALVCCLVLPVLGLPISELPVTESFQNAGQAAHPRELSWADRVAYQHAIEEVYWRHRIWPVTRTDPKPSLDEVMPTALLEEKVREYLRNSQALEEFWQQPLRPEQLQAEMERMAQETGQPDVLRELFAALGNDPFVIAECLARSTLSERLLTNLSAQDPGRKDRFESWRARVENPMALGMGTPVDGYRLPTISDNGSTNNIAAALGSSAATPTQACADAWAATSTAGAPAGRQRGTAVWTGSEMIVFGGENGIPLNFGGRYNPTTDSWVTIGGGPNAPTPRARHTAVWTGTEMIVWGGDDLAFAYYNTGGRYNPGTNSFTATSTANAPAGRRSHTAVWTGSEMIVWGGAGNTGVFNNGGRYNPSTNSWTATSVANAPSARYSHTAVWTGSEMIVWGGVDGPNCFNTGGRYNPSTDTWTATTTVNAPDARTRHTMVWAGAEMIVWGGSASATASNRLNTGGRYNPAADSWTATTTASAPSMRTEHTAVWTGNEMMVWGGDDGGPLFPNTGGRYNPGGDLWLPTTTTNAPRGRTLHLAVWTGSEMIVWGGFDSSQLATTGGRYCAQVTPTPTPTPGSPTPTATTTPTPTPTPAATATVTPTATPASTPGTLGNISTRLRVLTGDNALIGGMIATGTVPKKVIIRAIGPTLNDFGVPGALQDPTLELFQGSTSIASNDDWRQSSQQSEIQNSGFAPNKDAESAIIATLTPNQGYTAVVRGKNGETGVGVVEAFDLEQGTPSKLGNISTRGFVDVDDNVMIAGLIVSPSNGTGTKILVRAMGPTLGDFGVSGFLADPTLELVNSSGSVIRSNDNWRDSQQSEIEAANLAPSHDEEAALVQTVPPGAYTAVVRGSGRTTGVGLVEAYNIP